MQLGQVKYAKSVMLTVQPVYLTAPLVMPSPMNFSKIVI
jgi:hypothetical protein